MQLNKVNRQETHISAAMTVYLDSFARHSQYLSANQRAGFSRPNFQFMSFSLCFAIRTSVRFLITCFIAESFGQSSDACKFLFTFDPAVSCYSSPDRVRWLAVSCFLPSRCWVSWSVFMGLGLFVCVAAGAAPPSCSPAPYVSVCSSSLF